MKGRYDHCAMQLIGAVLPGARRFRRVSLRLSPEAKRRLAWLDWYRAHGQNARATCRHFGISPDTFYRWHGRFLPGDLASLEDDRGTRRPHQVRIPTTPAAVVARVKALREAYPRWGKAKLVVLLRREGIVVSESTVGRVLGRLKAAGRLVEPPRLQQARAARRRKRPWAQRTRYSRPGLQPGDVVQVDTVFPEIVPGIRRPQFTSWDRVSKWNVVAAYTRPTSGCAADFLRQLLARMPFPVRALQVDGGSEFKKEFEAACQAAQIPLWVLPPKSPKLNGGVERSNRTHREEFYEVEEVALTVTEQNVQLRAQEQRYNTFRPHQTLGQQTPLEFLARWPGLQARGRNVYGIY